MHFSCTRDPVLYKIMNFVWVLGGAKTLLGSDTGLLCGN
jgi:hypothetical protein